MGAAATAAPRPREYPSRMAGGRPRVPDRDCADAIFYVLRTGCQWRALDQTELCAHSTAHDRFQKWVQAGVFLKLWQAESDNLMSYAGSTGTGSLWTEPWLKPHWAEKKLGPIRLIVARAV